MINLLRIMIANILTALYQPFWFSVILSVLFMAAYMTFRDVGVKGALRQWGSWFRQDALFRRMFFLVFYTTMILFRTLLNRNMWANPISDVIGVWGLYNAKGEFTTEVPENLALFVPFAFLLVWTLQSRANGRMSAGELFWKGTKTTALFSLVIEFLQLFLRLGTWQLSDLFFNTAGGMAGSGLYCVWLRLKRKKAQADAGKELASDSKKDVGEK